jgi:hypothetical protein
MLEFISNTIEESHLLEIKKRLQKIEDRTAIFINGEDVFQEIENLLNTNTLCNSISETDFSVNY